MNNHNFFFFFFKDVKHLEYMGVAVRNDAHKTAETISVTY